MELAANQLTGDHVDLLVTAARHWGLLPSSSPYSTSRDPEASLTEDLHRASCQAAASRRIIGVDEALRSLTTPITHRPVLRLEPLEVLKATHAAMDLCSESTPDCLPTSLCQILVRLAIAAGERLPGYDTTPYIWSRPEHRDGTSIGLATAWVPDVEGVDWLQLDAFVDRWQVAKSVLITSEALDLLPIGLPARGQIFVVDPHGPDSRVWNVGAEAVTFWPDCREWLTEQVNGLPPHEVVSPV